MLSDELRTAVRMSGLSIRRLAKNSDVDQGSISRWLRCERGLSERSLNQIADAVGVQLVASPSSMQTVSER